METIFMKTKNSKTNEPHKFLLHLFRRLNLKGLGKYFALQNLFIYYAWKNIRKQCKINKLKIIAPIWTDELELPDDSYSVSDIQYCIKHIMKKHEILTTIPPIHVYINRINNRLLFKIKDGSKLELQKPGN